MCPCKYSVFLKIKAAFETLGMIHEPYMNQNREAIWGLGLGFLRFWDSLRWVIKGVV